MAVVVSAAELGLKRHSVEPQLLSRSLRDSAGFRPMLTSRELWCITALEREGISNGADESLVKAELPNNSGPPRGVRARRFTDDMTPRRGPRSEAEELVSHRKSEVQAVFGERAKNAPLQSLLSRQLDGEAKQAERADSLTSAWTLKRPSARPQHGSTAARTAFRTVSAARNFKRSWSPLLLLTAASL